MQQHTSIVKQNSQGYSSSYLISGLSLALNKIQLLFAVVDTHLL